MKPTYIRVGMGIGNTDQSEDDTAWRIKGKQGTGNRNVAADIWADTKAKQVRESFIQRDIEELLQFAEEGLDVEKALDVLKRQLKRGRIKV